MSTILPQFGPFPPFMKTRIGSWLPCIPSVWTPTVGEELHCRKEHRNTQDPFTVAVLDGTTIVGHVPPKISSFVLCFSKEEV